jgi:hypothetical protein
MKARLKFENRATAIRGAGYRWVKQLAGCEGRNSQLAGHGGVKFDGDQAAVIEPVEG